jgi:hypothetical protein
VPSFGDRGNNIEAVRRGRVEDALKAKPAHQGGMLDQEVTQVGHITLALVEFDQEGSDEGRARVGVGAGPISVGRALRELVPRQIAQKRAIVLDKRVVLDPSGQPSEGMGQWAEVGERIRRRKGPEPRQGSAQSVELGGKIE